MIKIFSIMLVSVVFLSLAGVAIAASPKPPASICFKAMQDQAAYYYALLIKPMGTIRIFDGPKKIYSVQGDYSNEVSGSTSAVSGSGHMDGSIFHFSLNGPYTWEETPAFFNADAYWDVDAKTGTIYSVYSNTVRYKWTLEQLPCSEF